MGQSRRCITDSFFHILPCKPVSFSSLHHLQGKLCYVLQCIAYFMGMGKIVKRLANAPTMEEQQAIYDSNTLVSFIKHGPGLLVWIFRKIVSALLFNKVSSCTFACGVLGA